jgi:sugar phosphate isomerase/epimerase
MRQWIMVMAATGILVAGFAAEVRVKDFQPPLFAFQTGFARADSREPAYLCELVKRAGFAGVELMGLGQVDAFMPELEARGLRLFTLYVKVDLDAEQPYEAQLKPTLQKWRGKIPHLWLHVHSRRFKKSDPAGDARCVEVLRELADFAKPLGVGLGIYPHTGFWAERFGDGVRVARKVGRENVGAVFNLCHYLRTDGPVNLDAELRAAFPHVMLVSINGAADGDTTRLGWSELIQPLGEGGFDVGRVLRVLKEQGYRGPIGLQGYGIQRRPEEFFPASVAAYRRYLAELKR